MTIEGDAFVIKQQAQGKQSASRAEVHHYRVYERVAGKVNSQHDFVSLGHRRALEARVSEYLDRHYKLKRQTIFLASDGGPGYEPATLMNLVLATAHGKYFIDRYHCLCKIEHTMGRDNPLTT